jgi:hypothetical protein
MDSTSPPSVASFLPASFVLMVVGWGGLIYLVNYTLPTIGPRWMFFFLFFLALTGTALPFAAFLNRRFVSSPPAGPSVVLRQAIWFSIYWSTLAWLQWGRVLNMALALLLAIGLILIEWLLRLRERSQWNPE